MAHTASSLITCFSSLAIIVIITTAAANSRVSAMDVVAEVNGTPITIRQLEDATLKQHGFEELVELVEERLRGARWAEMSDNQIVVAVPGAIVRRIDIALAALEQHGAKVRSELITMLATKQAIAKAGIIIDRALVDAEVAREQRRFSRQQEAAGLQAKPFEQEILAKEGISIRAWRRSEALRVAAGLHELVLRQVQPDEQAIQEHFALFPERFEQREAVQLQSIFIPFRRVQVGNQVIVDHKHQQHLKKVMPEIYRQIQQGRQSFAETWAQMGAMYDQMAEDGLVGWVDRMGNTSMPGVQAIPANVRQRAFAANLDNGPQLLPPIASDDGVRLVKVLAYRPELKQAFSEIRDAVRRDLVEQDIERHTESLIDDILYEADYSMAASWAGLIDLRQQDRQQLQQTIQDPAANQSNATSGTIAVAEVGGVPITLRQLEDAILQQEGTRELLHLVEERLKGARWPAIDDDQMIVSLPDGAIRRIELAVRVLEHHGSNTIRALVTMLATRQAVARAGITIDRDLVDAEIAREQQRFNRRLTASGRLAMPFEEAIMAKEGISIRQWRRSDEVRMAAGLHELVLQRAQVDDQTIDQHFAAVPQRFEQVEAVKLQSIFIPFKRVKIGQQEINDPEHQRNLTIVMDEIYRRIAKGDRSFAESWASWGSGYDQMAEDGHVGWVDRRGNTSAPGVQAIPDNVRQQAFAAILAEGAQLLPPITSHDGIRIIKVLDYRPAIKHSLADIRDLVRRDVVEQQLRQQTTDVLKQILDQADITVLPLPRIVQQRRQVMQQIEDRATATAQPNE